MTVYLIGDLHGSLGNIRNAMGQVQEPQENDIIIVAGDAGLEYGSIINSQCKKQMKKFLGSWVIMRGNHDTRYHRDHINSKGWHSEIKWNNLVLVQDKYPNIYYILDEGGLYNIEGNNILFVPGAYSVDKEYRLICGKPYEHEEQLTYKEWQHLFITAENNLDKIDYVIAHTGPLFIENFISDLFLAFIKQEDVDKSTEKAIEQLMETVREGKKFKHFFFGHYHDSREINKYYTMLYRILVKLEDYNG